jgi:hypothetical protein
MHDPGLSACRDQSFEIKMDWTCCAVQRLDIGDIKIPHREIYLA